MQFKGLLALALTIIGSLALATQDAAARTISIVGLGDSLMAAYGLEASQGFPARLEAALKARGHDVAVTDAGVSGDTTSGGLARLDWSVPESTDGVILELGANDALRGLPPEATAQNLETMILRLKERNIPVLLAGMLAPPNMGSTYESAFNAIYPDLAARHDLPFYPFFLDGVTGVTGMQLEDGMHPNAAGIDVMVQRFLPVVEAFVIKLMADAP